MSGIVSDMESNPSLVDSVLPIIIFFRFNKDMRKQKRESKDSSHFRLEYVVIELTLQQTSTYKILLKSLILPL